MLNVYYLFFLILLLQIENILFAESNYVLCDFGSATGRVMDPSHQKIAAIEEEIQKYVDISILIFCPFKDNIDCIFSIINKCSKK